MSNPYAQYQNMQVISASPEKILIMLYEGAIKFSKVALDRMEKNDIPGKGAYIGKALAIVTELMNTLNHEVGGDVSINLERLYIYLIGELTEANVKNSAAALQSSINVLSTLRDGWVEAIEVVKKEKEVGQNSCSLARAAG